MDHQMSGQPFRKGSVVVFRLLILIYILESSFELDKEMTIM
jgi:hypothetical protein